MPTSTPSGRKRKNPWRVEKSALAVQRTQRADDLYVQNLRLQLELGRAEQSKKWYYGPRKCGPAPQSSRASWRKRCLDFGEKLEQQPVHPEDVAAQMEPASEGRRVKRRRGRRALANFENLPVTTQVYELSGKERACPCCGEERQEIGAEESWQIEYLPGALSRAYLSMCVQEVCLRVSAKLPPKGRRWRWRRGRNRPSSAAWRGRGC